MFRFDTKLGYYLYPEVEEGNKDVELWLNSGTTYESNVRKREDIKIIKHGLKIPQKVHSYQDFMARIKDSEEEFRAIFNSA